jgi:hypothetical protein
MHAMQNPANRSTTTPHPHLKLTPYSLQPKLNLLQLLRRGLPVLKQAQQLLHLAAQLLLDKVLLQQPAHRPRQKIRVLRRRGRGGLVVPDAQLEDILLLGFAERLADNGDVDAREAGAVAGPFLRLWGDGEAGCFEGVGYGEGVDARVLVDARVALAAV